MIGRHRLMQLMLDKTAEIAKAGPKEYRAWTCCPGSERQLSGVESVISRSGDETRWLEIG